MAKKYLCLSPIALSNLPAVSGRMVRAGEVVDLPDGHVGTRCWQLRLYKEGDEDLPPSDLYREAALRREQLRKEQAA